jgi:hypothetical protein
MEESWASIHQFYIFIVKGNKIRSAKVATGQTAGEGGQLLANHRWMASGRTIPPFFCLYISMMKWKEYGHSSQWTLKDEMGIKEMKKKLLLLLLKVQRI